MKTIIVKLLNITRILCLIAVLSHVSPSVAKEKLDTLRATITYYAPENITLEQARFTALERACIQALGDRYGTIVSKYDDTRINNKSGIDYTTIGSSVVKGEWIKTLGEPDYHISYEQNQLVITVSVAGLGRPIVSAPLDLKVQVLRNGTEERYESDEFRSGDDFYLSFQSPVSGFLVVYLVDAQQNAYCLLPYRNQQEGIYTIKANQRYLFFNIKDAPDGERSLVDEYTMTCDGSGPELNQIYVVFSPHAFAKATDQGVSEALPRQLPYRDFNKWLVKHRRLDKDMNLRMIPITISPKP